MILKSGSSKHFQEPRIGKLDFDHQMISDQGYMDSANGNSQFRTSNQVQMPPQCNFSDSVESLQRRIDSQARENEDLK